MWAVGSPPRHTPRWWGHGFCCSRLASKPSSLNHPGTSQPMAAIRAPVRCHRPPPPRGGGTAVIVLIFRSGVKCVFARPVGDHLGARTHPGTHPGGGGTGSVVHAWYPSQAVSTTLAQANRWLRSEHRSAATDHHQPQARGDGGHSSYLGLV